MAQPPVTAQPNGARLRLGEMLMRDGLLTAEQVGRALEEQKAFGGRLGRHFVDLGFISDAVLLDALSRQLRIPRVDIEAPGVLSADASRYARADLAEQWGFLPISFDAKRNTLLIAVSDPDQQLLADIESFLAMKVEPRIAPADAIERVQRRLFHGDGSPVKRMHGLQVARAESTRGGMNDALSLNAPPAPPPMAAAPPPPPPPAPPAAAPPVPPAVNPYEAQIAQQVAMQAQIQQQIQQQLQMQQMQQMQLQAQQAANQYPQGMGQMQQPVMPNAMPPGMGGALPNGMPPGMGAFQQGYNGHAAPPQFQGYQQPPKPPVPNGAMPPMGPPPTATQIRPPAPPMAAQMQSPAMGAGGVSAESLQDQLNRLEKTLAAQARALRSLVEVLVDKGLLTKMEMAKKQQTNGGK